MTQARSVVRSRADKKRDDWLYENNLMWQFLVDQTGTKDFKVKP